MASSKPIFLTLITVFLTANCGVDALADTCETQGLVNIEEANNDSCFYVLSNRKTFIYNSSKVIDHNVQRINIRVDPTSPNFDAHFKITCSVPAKMNITVITKAKDADFGPEKVLLSGALCNQSSYETSFLKKDYHFAIEEREGRKVPCTSFLVTLYDFQAPIAVESSCKQRPLIWISCTQYMIVATICLIVIAASIVYKVKQNKIKKAQRKSEICQSF